MTVYSIVTVTLLLGVAAVTGGDEGSKKITREQVYFEKEKLN